MTDATLHAITVAATLGQIPAMRSLAAMAVKWEQEMNGLAVALDLPLDVVKERFAQRRLRSRLSWRDLVAEIMGTGEL